MMRFEAARKLITNRAMAVMDITNEAPVTQFELKRVGVRDQPHVDQCLREVPRRLLGGRPGAAPLPEERLDPLMPAQAAAWSRRPTTSTAASRASRRRSPDARLI